MNASIEAEKAGEYGRGFTVVAREIRRLADQTAVATLDIEQMVREMQSAVSSGVMEMDKFIAEVRNSAEDVRTISAKLAVIIRQVQALSPRFEEVNVVMANLGQETQETRASLHETYSVIEQLNEAAKGLQQEMSRFKIT
jgi:methyl-accepting chemotaxis protein WspA